MNDLMAQAFSQSLGSRILSPRMVNQANIGNVMRLFRASGASEKERLEMGYYMQRMILEGASRGVDVYHMLKQKAGGIHIDPIKDDSQGHDGRMQKFMVQVAKQLVSSRPAPTGGATGAPKMQYSAKTFQDIEKDVRGVTLGDSMNGIFGALGTYQKMGGLAPTQGTVTGMKASAGFSSEIATPGSTTALKQAQIRGSRESGDGTPMPGIATAKFPTIQPQHPVGEMASGRPGKALVYTGGGTWSAEATQYINQLKGMGFQVDAKSSLAGTDYSQYGALFVPGGHARDEYNAIGGTEAGKIRDAISNGLNYFGSCAGAFLAGDYGGWGLKLVPKAIDYTQASVNQGGVEHLQNETMQTPGMIAANGGKADARVVQYGGPSLDGIAGKVLSKYSDGEVSMVEAMYGKGEVILTGGHPAVPFGGVDDSAIFAALAKAAMAGTDPGGTAVQPTGGAPAPTGTGTNTNTTNINTPPSVTPISSGQSVSGGGSAPQVVNNVNTPVAGMLDPSISQATRSFAAGIQSMGGIGGGSLSNLGGELARLGAR